MNKEDALKQLPSVCTTAETIATNFMQVMHVHRWMSMGIGGNHCTAHALRAHCTCTARYF